MKPRRYVMWGVLLFVWKYLADLIVARGFFNHPWPLINYLAPTRLAVAYGWPEEDTGFLFAMLLVALPFMIAGLIVTIRRLRDAQLSFAPFINLLFFAALCFIPSRTPDERAGEEAAAGAHAATPPLVQAVIQANQDLPSPPRRQRFPWSLFPSNSFYAALVAILLPPPFLYLVCVFSVNILGDYGWGLFIGLPFILGLSNVVLYGLRTPRSAAQCTNLSLVGAVIMLLFILFFAFEGVICVIMAAPLWIPLTWLGGYVGYLIQKRPMPTSATGRMLATLLLMLPMLMALDQSTRTPPPLRSVTSSVIISAPPSVVWRNVIQFPALPEPTEWIFHTGIAYPTSATITGTGPGAIRRCVFTTGEFVEPIRVWDENRLLRFGVSYNPPVMTEWNFGRRIHPPHLKGFFESRQGEFLLEDLGDGRTRLIGTTWYEHNLWPTAYWYQWTDWIVHRIHIRVLDHVKNLSEHPQTASAAPSN